MRWHIQHVACDTPMFTQLLPNIAKIRKIKVPTTAIFGKNVVTVFIIITGCLRQSVKRACTWVCCVALPCLFDLACFFLPSFSSLIKTCMHCTIKLALAMCIHAFNHSSGYNYNNIIITIGSIPILLHVRVNERWRRKEERNKQGQTNNKAKHVHVYLHMYMYINKFINYFHVHTTHYWKCRTLASSPGPPSPSPFQVFIIS